MQILLTIEKFLLFQFLMQKHIVKNKKDLQLFSRINEQLQTKLPREIATMTDTIALNIN